MTGPRRILIVDDDRGIHRLLQRAVGEGCSLACADSGERALELVREFRPDLILLDIGLPGIDGYEVCRRVRADERFGLIKIVLVSGKGSVEERMRGYGAGADDYIVKPFESEELRAKVDVFLRLKRSEEVDRIKSDLLALFEHETKTPIAGILGLADILKQDASLSSEQRMCAELIHENGLQLLDFVRKTTLLCALKSGAGPQRSGDEMGMRLRRIAEAFGPEAERKRVRLALEVVGETEMYADWDMIDEVLGYLVDNAIKFSPEGAEVRLRAVGIEDRCVVQVLDRGAGVEPEWRDKIFDEFAIRDVMHHGKGQGLSLAITRHVAELHGGSVRVDDAPDGGAAFTLELPRDDVRDTVPLPVVE